MEIQREGVPVDTNKTNERLGVYILVFSEHSNLIISTDQLLTMLLAGTGISHFPCRLTARSNISVIYCAAEQHHLCHIRQREASEFPANVSDMST